MSTEYYNKAKFKVSNIAYSAIYGRESANKKQTIIKNEQLRPLEVYLKNLVEKSKNKNAGFVYEQLGNVYKVELPYFRVELETPYLNTKMNEPITVSTYNTLKNAGFDDLAELEISSILYEGSPKECTKQNIIKLGANADISKVEVVAGYNDRPYEIKAKISHIRPEYLYIDGGGGTSKTSKAPKNDKQARLRLNNDNTIECDLPLKGMLKDEDGLEYSYSPAAKDGLYVIRVKDGGDSEFYLSFFDEGVNEVYLWNKDEEINDIGKAKDIGHCVDFFIVKKDIDILRLYLKPKPQDKNAGQKGKKNTRHKSKEEIENNIAKILESDKSILGIDENTSQINNCKKALEKLMYRPSPHHKPLLAILDSDTKAKNIKDNTKLEEISPSDSEIDFIILGKGGSTPRAGTKRQQEFVKKALNTKDFMILEGPPGSGKTTAILELIYQATKLGERVLLCCSTHVAIDNVLERIINDENASELLGCINPVRISANEDNVYTEDIKPYLLQGLRKGLKATSLKDMLKDSFNLVCGTIHGVLGFDEMKSLLHARAVGGMDLVDREQVPVLFDYLIIDESSKTTLADFLVPALFAKKHIVVGDIKQLAPYVEDKDIKEMLEMPFDIKNGKTIFNPLSSKDTKNAIKIIQLLNREDKDGRLSLEAA